MIFQLTEKMSDNKSTTETMVTSLEGSLDEMPENLRLFSLPMRALYSDQNVGTSTEDAHKFAELRDNTRDDAKLYVKVILPLTTKFVSSIQEFFEFYEALSYEEWCEMLPDILENVRTHNEFAQTLRKTYDTLIAPLKKRQDEAELIATEFKTLTPALTNFINGLTKAAGFVEIMEIELESFQKMAENDKESRKRIHYKMMKEKAKKITPSFYAALPVIRTDFEAIPDEGTEQNYIDKWLEEKLTEISKKKESTQKAFVDALKGIEGIRLKLPKHFSLSLKPADTS